MSSSTPPPTIPNYDVFLSFRGLDTRRNFISFLYRELVRRNIRTFKDDKELKSGRRISPELERAIEESRFAVVVISANYAASTWCLQELVKIMDFENRGYLTVIPVFYGVEPCHVRRQNGKVAVQFKKHEKREDHEKVLSWKQALTNLASISGVCTLKWVDDSMMVDEIAERISQDRHMSHLHQELLKRVQVESNQKVLLVANEVNKLEQLDALAEDFSCFGPGSIVIITTQDKQLLVSAGIKLVYEVELLRFRKVRELFRQLGFRVRERAIESVLCKETNLAMKWLGCCLPC